MDVSLFLDNNTSQFMIRYGKEEVHKPVRKPKQKPISVSSDLQVLVHTKKRMRRNDSNQIPSLQKSVRKSPQVHSLHTYVDQPKSDKEFSRIPIEYMEERDTGNPADRVRGRVVYRGYAPKNTYFYFKTIKQMRIGSSSRLDKDYRGEDILFNSKFQSGNLNTAVKISSRQYWLYMREDTNTHGLRQWFYFQARARKKLKVRLRIYKFSKRFSLYKHGMRPYIRTVDSDWHQEGQKLKYEYDQQQKCYYIEFEYVFQEHKETYFATLPPYTYTMLTEYLQTLSFQEKVNIKKIGTSLSGLDIQGVCICHKKQPQKHHDRDKIQADPKEAIIVLARTHPGETVSNFALETFIAQVLKTQVITDKYNFYIVPMVNPDGVFLGNHRTGVLGQDLNRNFHSMDAEFFPEVEAIQNYILGIQKKHKIAFLFDLHGHSAKKNIFAYGDQTEIGSREYLLARAIPKILSNLIDSFKYDFCVFKASKEKQNTARVYFANKNKINALTFQQSYGLLDSGSIGIANWQNFGTALAHSLIAYLQYKSQEQISQSLTKQIIKQKQVSQKHKEKQKQKQKEQLRMKLIFSKTEGNEQFTPKNFVEMYRRTKIKDINQSLNKISEQKPQTDYNSQEEELSSGDEEMEMSNYELDLIKKQIVRVGYLNKQVYKREVYNVAEKNVQLNQSYFADYSHRLHHKHSSIIQRIFKFRSKQKSRDCEPPLSHRDKSIELPVIRK